MLLHKKAPQINPQSSGSPVFKPKNTVPATKSGSVIDTIVLITESFFYVMETAWGVRF